MADLKTESASLSSGSSKMSHASDPLVQPLGDFKNASNDLSAFGALGSLLSATGQIRDGMDQLTSIVTALHGEWQAEAKAIGDVGKVLDQVDEQLKDEAAKRQG
ncbi:hypothetical protein NGB36_26275 [Streptomyces sp. RB6PN25]|uniref:WXG100 family type VII secretion target n=1 Tax=Streptomyces humicola TaxID=2953240 RepID=A0ABT1Q237_9ACTN|nr:hypothetical protein [Streptomyces humicola]MCQ4083998.1 hypothetical protein [Streptomyces humicola]